MKDKNHDKLYLYPIWVRIWHLINAIMFLALVFTGLTLQYSSVDFEIIKFNYSISIHNYAGIILSIFFVFFLFANRFTSNGNYYQFHIKGLYDRVMKQFMYYSFGIFKNEEKPFPITKERKFNPLQKLSYVLIMYFFVPIIIITGYLLLFPDIIPKNILGFSGIHFVDLIHIILGFVLSIFIIVHVYFCTIGKTPLSNFKSMINGWH
ncbi:MAG: hypothetical protein C0595_11125 [Marinilabiliales bacterium]|nr:MAG: hypothetical protein C0595_11125 [Marinilabiliales bacterium]